MYRLITILFVSLLTFSSRATIAQDSPELLIEKFFNEYPKNARKAVDNLYATNKWTNRITDGIDEIKSSLDKLSKEYVGEYYGTELINIRSFSPSFVMYSYMVKYDRQPLRFIFMFYKPNDKWTLHMFSFDGNLTQEMTESGKLYYMRLDK